MTWEIPSSSMFQYFQGKFARLERSCRICPKVHFPIYYNLVFVISDSVCILKHKLWFIFRSKVVSNIL